MATRAAARLLIFVIWSIIHTCAGGDGGSVTIAPLSFSGIAAHFKGGVL
jgi:uncharacterized membrane protein